MGTILLMGAGLQTTVTGPTYDPDAQAYFTVNTAITSAADKTAINDFYLGLKSDGIYNKIKCMYFPIWLTSGNCKWNLVNNRAYDLAFTGGWTYAFNGSTPNGTSAYADTFFTPNGVLSQNSQHFSVYSRTNNQTGGVSFGGRIPSPEVETFLRLRDTSNYYNQRLNSNANMYVLNPSASSLGFFIMNRIVSNQVKVFRNGAISTTSTNTSSGNLNSKIFISARRDGTNPPDQYDNKQISFVTIGDGLTDTEAVNFSNRVNTLMAYFGINTYPVVSDSDAQAYINANDAITSQSDANAINTFFAGLKADGIYTKIKAMYLPIWGSPASSKWNLINNRSYDLTYGSGMTFNSGGMLPNGTSAFANTQLVPSTAYGVDHNKHMSFYSRTNAATGTASSSIGSSNSTSGYCRFTIRGSSNQRAMVYGGTNGTYADTETSSLGFYLGNRSSSTASQFYKNGSLISNGNATNSTTSNIPQQLLICAAYDVSSITYYDNKQCAFASIGDSLTSTEVTNFYNRVQTLMTYFGINV